MVQNQPCREESYKDYRDLQTKQLALSPELDINLLFTPHCLTCVPAWLILYHVVGLRKRPIALQLLARCRQYIIKLKEANNKSDVRVEDH